MAEPTEDEQRAWVLHNLEIRLEVLIMAAYRNGLVIEVNYARPHPLDFPVMTGSVRCARGFYPKEKEL
jgi:hypothetical protein